MCFCRFQSEHALTSGAVVTWEEETGLCGTESGLILVLIMNKDLPPTTVKRRT